MAIHSSPMESAFYFLDFINSYNNRLLNKCHFMIYRFCFVNIFQFYRSHLHFCVAQRHFAFHALLIRSNMVNCKSICEHIDMGVLRMGCLDTFDVHIFIRVLSCFKQ